MEDELFLRLRKSGLVDHAGLSFKEFRKRLTPQFAVVWLNIAATWMCIIVCNVFLILFPAHGVIQAIVVAVGALLIGFLVAYLQLFIHEGAHRNIHSDPK